MTGREIKKYCVILGILLIFMLSGCQRDKRTVLEDSALEKSEWQELPSGGTFSVELLEPVTVKSRKISVCLVNDEESPEQEYYFHEDIYVEKKLGDEWYSYAHPYNPLEFAVIFEPGRVQEREWEAPLEKVRLSVGHYRAVWEVYDEEGTEILASTEFEVTE